MAAVGGHGGGTRIGKYLCTKNLGQGEFGKVKYAKDEKTGDEFALKIIDKSKLDEQSLKMVTREVTVMKLLDHENIVSLYDVIDTPTELILVLEYCPGGEIFDYLVAHGRLQEREARRFFRELLGALDYCHKLRVVHRDLKLENVLLSKDRAVKVTDFGFANCFSSGSLLKTFCGSPNYASPEIVQAKPYTGPEVDMWSAGVLIYVLVAGRLPFDAPDVAHLFKKIAAADFKMRSSFSKEFRDLITKLLEPHAERRMTCQQAIDHPWTNIGYDAPVPVAAFDLGDGEVDNAIIDTMIDLGFDRLKVLGALQAKEENEMTATYAVMLKSKRDRAAKKAANSDSEAPQPSQPSANKRRHRRSCTADSITAKDVQAALTPATPQGLPPRAGPPAASSHKRHRRRASHGGEPIDVASIHAPARRKDPGHLPPLSPAQAPPSGRRRRKSSVGSVDASVLGSVPEVAEPRSVRFAFSVSTTSAKPPQEMKNKIITTLEAMSIQFTEQLWTIHCEHEQVALEIEICKIPRINLNGVRVKRISGNAWLYKQLCSRITEALDL